MKKQIGILLGIVFVFIPLPARAQFGFAQTIILGKMLVQDVLIYGAARGTDGHTAEIGKTVTKSLDLAQRMAQTIDTFRYQGLQGLLWQLPYLLQKDPYGRAIPWTKAAQGKMSANVAYQAATVPVPQGEWPAYYAAASPAQQNRIAVEYADVLDTDAAGAEALAVIGDTNLAMPSGQLAVENLAHDNFASGFAESNPQLSQEALMQKQNIGTTMGLKLQYQNLQLQKNILEQLVLINRRARNEEAKKLNSDRIIHTQTAQNAQSSGDLASVLNSLHY